MAIGTPAYMAPEQIAADPAADHRMDLYALGLLAYEMLTGEVPFKEDSPQRTMAAQLTREPSPVEQSRADVPAALSALVRRLLAKLPEERPQLASEVVAQLDEIAVSSGASLAPLKATPAPGKGRVALLAAVGIVIVATAWALGQRTGGEAVGAFVRDSLLAADSSQVVASAAAMLTREDSMAIAAAVASRMSERPAPVRQRTTGADRARDSVAIAAWADSLRAQIQRSVLDSLVQFEARRMRFRSAEDAAADAATLAEAAGTVAGAARAQVPTMSEPSGAPALRSSEPRRVVVAMPRNTRGRADLDAIATTLADSLRERLGSHPRFRVIPADSVAAALRESRTVNTVQERLDADLIVSISLIPTRDSVVRMVQMRDLRAPDGLNYRAVTSTVPLAAPTAGLRELMPRVLRSLFEMERGARIPRPPATEGLPPRP
jgi:serine/threonine-protein kinase